MELLQKQQTWMHQKCLLGMWGFCRFQNPICYYKTILIFMIGHLFILRSIDTTQQQRGEYDISLPKTHNSFIIMSICKCNLDIDMDILVDDK